MGSHLVPEEDTYVGRTSFGAHLTVRPIGMATSRCIDYFLRVPGQCPWQRRLPDRTRFHSPDELSCHQVETDSNL